MNFYELTKGDEVNTGIILDNRLYVIQMQGNKVIFREVLPTDYSIKELDRPPTKEELDLGIALAIGSTSITPLENEGSLFGGTRAKGNNAKRLEIIVRHLPA